MTNQCPCGIIKTMKEGNNPEREVIKMTEKFRVELKSLVNTCKDAWAGICPRTYTKTVEAESEMEAIEKAKTQVVAEALSRGYDEEVTITKVEKLADIKAQQEKERMEREEKERQAKEKKLANEKAKAEALGMTVEEYRKDKANKAYCRKLEKEIAELEEQLKEKKRKLAKRRGE